VRGAAPRGRGRADDAVGDVDVLFLLDLDEAHGVGVGVGVGGVYIDVGRYSKVWGR
jgi:hypothetical protein